MKVLLVPVSLKPVLVAVRVKLPVLEIVTLCEANTPPVKAAVVPLPEESIPLEVMFTVPVNPVTVLLLPSRAVTLTLNALPAVCVGMVPPPELSTRKFAKTPGSTVKVLLVPVWPDPSSAVIVLAVPVCVTVTDCVNTPAVKLPEVVGAIVPAVVDNPTVPVKPVTVLFVESCAVNVMLKAVPATCGLVILPIAK